MQARLTNSHCLKQSRRIHCSRRSMTTVVDLTNDSDVEDDGMVSFTIMGPPQAMPRVRFFKNGIYNKKSAELVATRQQIKLVAPRAQNGILFQKGTPVKMSIGFFIRRPQDHFKGISRSPENIRMKARQATLTPIAPDIDNLIKFVLDALIGVIYHDDRQVVMLTASKQRDSQGSCGGRTVVTVEKAV